MRARLKAKGTTTIKSAFLCLACLSLSSCAGGRTVGERITSVGVGGNTTYNNASVFIRHVSDVPGSQNRSFRISTANWGGPANTSFHFVIIGGWTGLGFSVQGREE
jgi:hypothetical protein